MVVLGMLIIQSVVSLSCLDSGGAIKDWWVMIKAPKVPAVPPLPGKSYIYIDQFTMGMSFSPLPLNESSAMTTTLKQLNDDPSISFVAYDDCPAPSCPIYNHGNGHVKGILAYTSNEAIMILHSFPSFPNISSSNYGNYHSVTLDINNPQMMYGQDMLCVTLNPTDLFRVAGLMSITLPNVFAHRVTQPNSNITLLINNKTISSAYAYSGYNYKTPNGFNFTYFSKSASAGYDIYEKEISPFYSDGMYCETWGRPYEPDFCPPEYKYRNLNIDEIRIGKYWWTSYNDHSKWSIGISVPFVCFTDMNRMESQWVRGGGALCTINPALHEYFKSITLKYDSC